jgi:hypothetical protein
MNPDPHVDRLLRPLGRRGCCRRGDVQTASHRRRDGIEDDIEAVTLGSDLGPIEALDRSADQLAIGGQQIDRRCGPVPLDEVRVSAKVGEQEAACD